MSESGLVERESWITHNGKKVLLHDYSGLFGEEAADAVANHADAVIKRGKRDLLMLADVTGAYADKAVLAAFKKHSSRNADYVKKVAVIGATGVTLFFLDIVTRFSGMAAKPFPTKEQALEWLVAD